MVPSLEQIEKMDRQRLQAINSLQITDNSVKCQKCSISVPMLRTLTKPRSNRIDALQKRVKWIENHSHGNNAIAEVKQLRQEIADLLEDTKANKLRTCTINP
jgi:hypothetical protein